MRLSLSKVTTTPHNTTQLNNGGRKRAQPTPTPRQRRKRVASLRSLQWTSRACSRASHSFRRAGSTGCGPPNRREERLSWGSNGFPVQPRRWWHQNPPAHYSSYEIWPTLRVSFLLSSIWWWPFSFSPYVTFPNSGISCYNIN